jgi:hypothetical protein
MPIAAIGHNEANDIVVNFEPDKADGWHAVFTLEEAEQFAKTILRRVRAVRKDMKRDKT